MKLPWISRRHHEEVTVLCGRLIGDRDERIRQLEAERRMLWDKICLLGIGAPVFGPLAPVAREEKADAEGSAAEARPADGEADEGRQAKWAAAAPIRPSAIMRRMDRLAEERYLRKVHPSRENEELAAMLGRHGRNQKS